MKTLSRRDAGHRHIRPHVVGLHIRAIGNKTESILPNPFFDV
jgi:hypothetical protein